MSKRSEEYRSFSKKITDLKTIADCDLLENRFERFYDLGLLSVNEFRALDLKLLDKRIKIEEQ